MSSCSVHQDGAVADLGSYVDGHGMLPGVGEELEGFSGRVRVQIWAWLCEMSAGNQMMQFGRPDTVKEGSRGDRSHFLGCAHLGDYL